MRKKTFTNLIILLILVFPVLNVHAQLFHAEGAIIEKSDSENRFIELAHDYFEDAENLERFLRQFHRGNSKIVNGDDVDIADYPWQVSVQLRPPHGAGHFCGGTIIDDIWVLTAAHCVVVEGGGGNDFVLNPAQIRVRSGFTVMNSTQGSFHNIAEIIPYPEYSTSDWPYDIALLRLENPINLEEDTKAKVSIVTQADEDAGMIDPGVIAKVSGWGALYYNGPAATILQAIEIPIVHVSNTSWNPNQITADMILAGFGGKDTCQGDSGGPLVVDDGFGWKKVAGVVSWGAGCGNPQYPGVYARVSYFEDWLNQYIVKDDPNKYHTYYYEDFGNGDIPAGWENVVIEGPEGFPGWEWTDAGVLNSTTADNGFMRLNSQAHGSPGVDEEAHLITAAINMSDVTTNIQFSVEHLARTFGSADISIHITNDDFETSTELYRWYDAAPNQHNGNNPVFSEFDITETAQGHENVKVKFKWIGSRDYWWMIDDVVIAVENTPVEVQFVVSDGLGPMSNTLVFTDYAGQEVVTDEYGITFMNLYEGDYRIFARKSGYLLYQEDIHISGEGEVFEIIMEEIPYPVIYVDPINLSFEVRQGIDENGEFLIYNLGDADLEYSLFLFKAPDSQKNNEYDATLEGGTAQYDGYELDNNLLKVSGSTPAENNTHSKAGEKLDQPVEIHHDYGHNNNGIGTGGTASFITAARFTADELTNYYGTHDLSSVKFHIRTNHFSEVLVKVWEGGSLEGPGEEIYSADATEDVVPGHWTTYDLSEMLPLQSGKEYWIGYAMQATGGHPASVDGGPMVEDKGAWMFFGNSWTQLTDLNPDLDFNWNIRGILEPRTGIEWLCVNPAEGTVEPKGEARINMLLQYAGLEPGDYHALIRILNNAGELIDVNVHMHLFEGGTLIDEIEADIVTVYPNPASSVININAYSNINEVLVYDMTGRLLISNKPGQMSTTIPVCLLEPGMYLIQVATPDNINTFKFQKQ